MPQYDYRCGSCEHTFEKTLKITDRDNPTLESCPSCGDREVFKTLISAPVYGDALRMGSTVKDKNGKWTEVLRQVHNSNYKSNLSLKFNGS
jgi:putative FmdB family regulatory protein